MAHPQPARPIHILLVEDNEDDVEVAKRMLEKSGVATELYVASDGREAMDLLFRQVKRGTAPRPDLVLLDIWLPYVDGRDILRCLKTDPDLCVIPVVILTGATEEGHLREAMELGTSMYVVKPMALADVMNIVVGVQRYWAAIDSLDRRDRKAA